MNLGKKIEIVEIDLASTQQLCYISVNILKGGMTILNKCDGAFASKEREIFKAVFLRL